ncbi:uncharacterized protein LOC108471043 isoform X2 [Gossypium arboreum]|uniref:uncharacterized protein LOC108471043 isoform X2 n=1 Tax=Gossypium arboreum TaxID=29729 RepID=UPI0022F16541|nr:uncharacterized protein LOC108471043 isoform X2 [Gossypium arboreum]
MDEATVSVILEQMTAITIDKAIEAWSLVQGAEKEVKRLETNFKAHRLELEDAEEKEYVDKRVKLWLDKFRYVSYDMEDVLDEWETAVQQLQTDPSGSASVRNWKLGLVIDSTNTSRYYQTTDLKKKGIKHVKIQCRGRDAVPENASVNTFVYEVSQFLLRQKSNKYILVHCTHGHNRTGYMIIHYLMRTQPMSVTRVSNFCCWWWYVFLVFSSICFRYSQWNTIYYFCLTFSASNKFFSEARPPGIYKPDYIDALYAFYHERRPESLVCPPTPKWKRSSDLDLNGEATADDDDDDDDDDGAPTALPVRGHAQFPGSHPVSLNRTHLSRMGRRCINALYLSQLCRSTSSV